ncbi:C40 family peptidase [Cohnella candidum]|uniref:NlpC/P60 family protein n=1 Tax=Cohnella candidum TaxID=2674991 RepID=A0A3G3JW31_9BACL|nr:C40 family peptidase [Cohnella candidum]AYQ72442.1 NlpC/P60 family protein [Cohnella candidum]
MISTNSQVTVLLFQRDYFTRKRRQFSNVNMFTKNGLHYLPLKDVMEILEYDILRTTHTGFVITDGSECITIPKSGEAARRENVTLRIDPLVVLNKQRYITLRSTNRLFNVDFRLNYKAHRICIKQPGRFFTTLSGDTLKKLSQLFNTTVKNVLASNTQLKEPIPSGTRVLIPAGKLAVMAANQKDKPVKIKQLPEPELAPAILALGRTLLKKPYQFGAGPYPRTGKFDCSSYTQYIFGKNGVRLTRTSRSQARLGRAITRSQIEPGDLIFFKRDRYSDNRIGHVGVDIGNGYMLNTYRSPPGVTITKWTSPYWLSRFVTAREIL